VLGCRDCGEGITMVHGTRSLFAYCPACLQLALQTTPTPAGHSDDGRPRVAVEEQCHLCGHTGLRVEPDLGSRPPVAGKVLPFRRRREESRDS
jgi:hypothetical protein